MPPVAYVHHHAAWSLFDHALGHGFPRLGVLLAAIALLVLSAVLRRPSGRVGGDREWYRGTYLRSQHWRARRARALELAGYRCTACDSSGRLDVHHRSYAHLGAERDDELAVLCRTCHETAETPWLLRAARTLIITGGAVLTRWRDRRRVSSRPPRDDVPPAPGGPRHKQDKSGPS